PTPPRNSVSSASCPASWAASARRSRPSTASSPSAVRPNAAAAPSASPARAGSARKRRTRSVLLKPRRARAPVVVGGSVLTRDASSDARERRAELVIGHLLAVALPFLTLVPQEELEDLLPQRARHQLRALEGLERTEQVGGQRLDAHRAPFPLGEVPDRVLRALGQLVLPLDPGHPGGQQDREGEVGVGGGVQAAELDAGAGALGRLVERHPHQRGAVVVAPADVARRLLRAPQALVGVHPLVG